MMSCGQGNSNPKWYEESFYNLQSGPVNTTTDWGMGECREVMYEDMTTKEAREGILGAILANLCEDYGVPVSCTSDGEPTRQC